MGWGVIWAPNRHGVVRARGPWRPLVLACARASRSALFLHPSPHGRQRGRTSQPGGRAVFGLGGAMGADPPRNCAHPRVAVVAGALCAPDPPPTRRFKALLPMEAGVPSRSGPATPPQGNTKESEGEMCLLGQVPSDCGSDCTHGRSGGSASTHGNGLRGEVPRTTQKPRRPFQRAFRPASSTAAGGMWGGGGVGALGSGRLSLSAARGRTKADKAASLQRRGYKSSTSARPD